MAEMDIKQSNFITRVVEAAPVVLEALEIMSALDAEWSALQYFIGGTNEIDAADFTGANQHMTTQALADVVYVYGLISNTADAAARANLYRARP